MEDKVRKSSYLTKLKAQMDGTQPVCPKEPKTITVGETVLVNTAWIMQNAGAPAFRGFLYLVCTAHAFFAVGFFVLYSHALAAFSAVGHNLTRVHRRGSLDDPAGLPLPAGLDVLGHDVHAVDDDLALFRGGRDDLSALALVVARDHDDLVVGTHVDAPALRDAFI